MIYARQTRLKLSLVRGKTRRWWHVAGAKISKRVAEMRLPEGIDKSSCRHPDWTGPMIWNGILELREITG